MYPHRHVPKKWSQRHGPLVEPPREKIAVTVYLNSDAHTWAKAKCISNGKTMTEYIAGKIHDEFWNAQYYEIAKQKYFAEHPAKAPPATPAYGVIPQAAPLPAKRKQHVDFENDRTIHGGYSEN